MHASRPSAGAAARLPDNFCIRMQNRELGTVSAELAATPSSNTKSSDARRPCPEACAPVPAPAPATAPAPACWSLPPGDAPSAGEAATREITAPAAPASGAQAALLLAGGDDNSAALPAGGCAGDSSMSSSSRTRQVGRRRASASARAQLEAAAESS